MGQTCMLKPRSDERACGWLGATSFYSWRSNVVGAQHEASASRVYLSQGQRVDWDLIYARKGAWTSTMLQGVTRDFF